MSKRAVVMAALDELCDADIKSVDLASDKVALLLIENPTLEDLLKLETYMALWVQARERSIGNHVVTEGSFRCGACHQVFDYEPITSSVLTEGGDA